MPTVKTKAARAATKNSLTNQCRLSNLWQQAVVAGFLSAGLLPFSIDYKID
jgi:hypothetical protein